LSPWQDPVLRAWLLMNLNVNPANGKIGWRVNIDAIHRAFKNDIVNFPYEEFEYKVAFDKPALFIGGADSDYMPVHHHPDIVEIFPQAEFIYVQVSAIKKILLCHTHRESNFMQGNGSIGNLS
jgi:hypothetical protein